MQNDTVADQSGQEIQGGEAAIGNQHQLASRQPPAGLQDHLTEHSVSFLCRLPCSRLCRSGADAVRNGSAQMRSAQGIGTSSTLRAYPSRA